MKRTLSYKILALKTILLLFFATSIVISKESRTTSTNNASQNGCQTMVTVIDLGCDCAGGFVFQTDDGRLLLPVYPFPHAPMLEDGQRFRANFVIEDPVELVVDCFDLGCSAQGYSAYFKCLQPLRNKQ